MTKELKNKETTELVDVSMFEQDLGCGMESVTADEIILPRLALLQSMSPATKKSSADYVEGAQEGMLLNRITKKMYDGEKGIKVVPLNARLTLVEFTPRDKGGNYVADHSDNMKLWDQTPYDKEKGGKFTAEGNKLVKSWELLVNVIEDNGALTPILINFASTQFKKGHQWVSALKTTTLQNKQGKAFEVPIFYSTFLLQSATETKDGNSWMGYKITRVGNTHEIDMGIYKASAELSKIYTKDRNQGKFKVEPQEEQAATGSSVKKDDIVSGEALFD